jgi:formylglycine-generating enzyme
VELPCARSSKTDQIGLYLACSACVVGFFVASQFETGAQPLKTPLNAAATQAATLTNSIGMKLALIPSGSFTMGAKISEPARPDEVRHRVMISHSFYLGVYEVTVAEFRTFVDDTTSKGSTFQTSAERGGQAFNEGRKGGFFMDENGLSTFRVDLSWKNTPYPQTDRHPVGFISWEDANAFVKWLREKEHKPYRLPTEAEWEYACKAGKDVVYPWGDGIDKTGTVANVLDYSAARYYPKLVGGMPMDDHAAFTAPVGSYKPNAFGLHDMIGNVWEWVQDFYDIPDNKAARDPKGPSSGSLHVAKGGGWGNTADRARCATRFRDPPDTRYSGTGLRVALEVD